MEHTANPLGDIFEAYLDSGKTDQKSRRIGYIVGLRDNGTDFYAWVQNARMDKAGEFFGLLGGLPFDFGVVQRSKKFTSQSAATAWAYSTARARIAKIGGAA